MDVAGRLRWQTLGVPLTRRAVLGLAALSVAGCHNKAKPVRKQPRAGLDAAALSAARVGELRLLASYDAALGSLPLHKRAPLQVERAIHAAHLAALPGPASSASPTPRPTHHLHAALRVSAADLRRLALGAVDGANAALLASIAASHTASAAG
jgi:hypothetical protein